MEICTLAENCVALLMAAIPDKHSLKVMISSMLFSSGIKPWPDMYIEVFSSPGLNLLIARPKALLCVRPAQYLVSFPEDIFTE